MIVVIATKIASVLKTTIWPFISNNKIYLTSSLIVFLLSPSWINITAVLGYAITTFVVMKVFAQLEKPNIFGNISKKVKKSKKLLVKQRFTKIGNLLARLDTIEVNADYVKHLLVPFGKPYLKFEHDLGVLLQRIYIKDINKNYNKIKLCIDRADYDVSLIHKINYDVWSGRMTNAQSKIAKLNRFMSYGSVDFIVY